MKNLWTCRRTFLSFLAIVGLLYIMDHKDKDHALEVVGLAGGVAFVNAWESKKKAKAEVPSAT